MQGGLFWGAGAEMFHPFNWYRRKRGEVVGASQMIRVQTVGVARENTCRLSAAKGRRFGRGGGGAGSDLWMVHHLPPIVRTPKRTDEMGPECGEKTGQTQGPRELEWNWTKLMFLRSSSQGVKPEDLLLSRL